MDKKTFKDYGAKAFIPFLIFLAIYLGSGIFYEIMGVEQPFNQIPRIFALFVGIAAAMLMGKDSFDDKMDLFTSKVGEKGIIIMILIFLMAGGFAGVAREMGGVDSVVNLGLTFIPQQFIIAGIFIIACFISLAMGTSMGTIAAIGPIAVGLAQQADLSLGIAISAVVGGAMFGDNLSIISDTTIAATRGVGCKMRDKFLMNFFIALPAAVITIVLYSILGVSGELQGPFEYELIKVLPYVGILIAALVGVNVIVVLLSGTLVAGVIGIVTGSMTFVTFAQAFGNGASGMYGLVVLALMIRGLIGLVDAYGGINWLVNSLSRNVKSRRGAELTISGLAFLVDVGLGNNTVAIMITAPMAKSIANVYNISAKKVASLLDIFACVGQSLIPYGGQMLLAGTIAGVSPILIMRFSFYQYSLAIFGLIAIFINYQGIKLKSENKVESDMEPITEQS